MNAYLTQPVRIKHGIEWQEEFILGLVSHKRTIRVTEILGASSEVMTNATSHKYLTQLLEKDLVKHDLKKDKRIKMVVLTKLGEKVIKELANVSALPSLALS
jgi:predicted transcriptional regulator